MIPLEETFGGDREYTLQTHTENQAALLDHLDVTDITFFGQDWGGPISSAYTVRHPERVKRLFLANTVAGYGQVADDVPRIEESPWFRWVAEGLETGRTARPCCATSAPPCCR